MISQKQQVLADFGPESKFESTDLSIGAFLPAGWRQSRCSHCFERRADHHQSDAVEWG